jgi:ATP-dependent Clp protease adaptor protein ClpS
MAGAAANPDVAPDVDVKEKPKSELDSGFQVICWNDPVNLMSYVTHVFQQVFGWPRAKAEKHMLEVHNQGKSILVRTSLEKAEHYVHRLHGYGLDATMEKSE